ncbi:zinc-dependent alcohol dehydrogenase family protein [Brevibacterium litoralis]|uniref:zinc-dependent alcohol dehydrogenase family protein n=1 Tax=Brevibacterium litoralis TaxID=3138935 RepID=UPI0032EB7A96
MKQIVVHAPGGLDRLELVNAVDPGHPGPGQIRVRLHASSLNFHDYLVVSGPSTPRDDRVPMADGAGVVESVGEGVTEFAEGDSVVSGFFPLWPAGPALDADFTRVPGDGMDGYARECVVTDATWFTHAPRDWSHAEAATITTAGLTAWRALVVNGDLKAGDTVLTLGSGGVSVYAIQLAKAMGAHVIATTGHQEKIDTLRELGADHVIDYREDPEWGTTVMELTGGRGADHVIEVGGAVTLPQSIRAVSIGGHISLIGVLSGRGGDIPTGLLMAKQARLEGLIVGSRRDQQDFVRALESTGLRPVIDRSFSLEEIAAAFRHQESQNHVGKIVLEW